MGDLIRLDSIPKEESFDPLDRTDSEETIAFPKGLINPLYPYYKLNGTTTTTTDSSMDVTKETKEPSSNISFLHRNSNVLGSSNFNKQDLDLLKEYGMDFRANTTRSDLTNNLSSNNDPFELSFDDSTVVKKKSNWATFE